MAWRCRWWFVLAVGLYLLVLLGCSEDELTDADPAQVSGEPTLTELGLRLAPAGLDLNGLSQTDIERIARGSYLVNGAGNCTECHSSAAGYLAGGVEFPLMTLPPDVQGFTSVIARNLTPDPATGMSLSEDEFSEAMRTGKDFHDSNDPQRLVVDPWPGYRFLSRDDLQAIYAFLQRIPAVHNDLRRTYKQPAPFEPTPFPAIGDGDALGDPDNAERGLLIPQFFASGRHAMTFVTRFNATVAALTATERAQVGRGSYLVNAVMNCTRCHTLGAGVENMEQGAGVDAVAVNAKCYLAGGVDVSTLANLGFEPKFRVLSRNLTRSTGSGSSITFDNCLSSGSGGGGGSGGGSGGSGGGGGGGGGTGSGGMSLSEDEFIQSMRLGRDFRRPGQALRTWPHFPVRYSLTLDDLQAVYAYLQAIPVIQNRVDLVP